MKTKHTPGPWSINTWKHQTDPSIRIGAAGTPVLAQVPSHHVSINEQKANAQLIEAAPELLEALIYFRNISADLQSSLEKGYIRQAQKMADDAIGKAVFKA